MSISFTNLVDGCKEERLRSGFTGQKEHPAEKTRCSGG